MGPANRTTNRFHGLADASPPGTVGIIFTFRSNETAKQQRMDGELCPLPFEERGKFIRRQTNAKLFHFDPCPACGNEVTELMNKYHPAQCEQEDD